MHSNPKSITIFPLPHLIADSIHFIICKLTSKMSEARKPLFKTYEMCNNYFAWKLNKLMVSPLFTSVLTIPHQNICCKQINTVSILEKDQDHHVYPAFYGHSMSCSYSSVSLQLYFSVRWLLLNEPQAIHHFLLLVSCSSPRVSLISYLCDPY